MKIKKYNLIYKILISLIILPFLLGFSNMFITNSVGQIGLYENSLMFISLILMLIIIIPVIFMTILFVYLYKKNNVKNNDYKPNWCHSNKIEIFSWLMPSIIVFFLAVITWKSTHILYNNNKIIKNIQHIEIEVVSLDWKWLFIYPKQKIAIINEISFPKNIPIKFIVTSNSVMNSFFIPKLGGQTYAMAGMKNYLNIIANKSGIYDGISSNFSGKGFSGMKFKTNVLSNIKEFNNWIKKIKLSKNKINNFEDFKKIAKPSEYNIIEYYSYINKNIFNKIINKFKN